MPTAQDEGVSCESCHNAAESWLRGHTRKDWNYAMRVTAGIRDLKSFYVRANTCVACHQNLDADILKAGHPELTFELDRQSVDEPKHWRDADPSSGLRAWLVGQAVALREMSWALSKNGTPNAEEINRWKGLAWLLAKATAQQTNVPVIGQPGETTSPVVFTGAQEQADSLARRGAESQLSTDFARQLLRALAKRLPNSLFQKKRRQICFFNARKDLSSHLIDSPLRLRTRARVKQKILRSHNYSKTFDRALIFRHHGSLSICEIFAQQSSDLFPRRSAGCRGARFVSSV